MPGYFSMLIYACVTSLISFELKAFSPPSLLKTASSSHSAAQVPVIPVKTNEWAIYFSVLFDIYRKAERDRVMECWSDGVRPMTRVKLGNRYWGRVLILDFVAVSSVETFEQIASGSLEKTG
jgi:hypothetical protein